MDAYIFDDGVGLFLITMVGYPEIAKAASEDGAQSGCGIGEFLRNTGGIAHR